VETLGIKFVESLIGRSKGWKRLHKPGGQRKMGEILGAEHDESQR